MNPHIGSPVSSAFSVHEWAEIIRERSTEPVWFVYMLQSEPTGVLYTGITNDLERRIKQHNTSGGAKFTRTRRPWKLVYVSPAPSKGEALKAEHRIKDLPREKKLELLLAFRS